LYSSSSYTSVTLSQRVVSDAARILLAGACIIYAFATIGQTLYSDTLAVGMEDPVVRAKLEQDVQQWYSHRALLHFGSFSASLFSLFQVGRGA
jgi:hypothetical protein